MTAVRLMPRRDPAKVPEHTLWTVRKNGGVRSPALVAVGEGLVELAIYEMREAARST